MKTTFFTPTALLVLLMAASCGSPTSESSSGSVITINGIVVDAATNQVMPNAIVELTVRNRTSFKVTGTDGAYRFDVRVDSLVTVTIRALKEGYEPVSQQAFGVPGRNITMPDIKLTVPGGGSGTPGPVTPGTGSGIGSAFSVQLQSVSHPTIQVLSTGGLEQSQITFVVRDSLGRAIDESKAVDVVLSFGARPNGGESLLPTTVRTDRNGTARTVIKSGTVSGVVQVVATVVMPGGLTLRSQPATVIIQGGLPDAARFSLSTQFLNLPGGAVYGNLNNITAFVGDRYGNHSPVGTPVYFTTDGGIITGSAATTTAGAAYAILTTAAPFPTHPTLGPGFATVTARTADINNATIQTSIVVLFSGPTTVSVSPQVVNVPNGGSQSFILQVRDNHGHPLSPGSKISVSVEGSGVEVLGDVDITLPDTQRSGPGTTEFRFTLQDSDFSTSEQKVVEIKIEVVSPNGNVSARLNGSSFKVLPGN